MKKWMITFLAAVTTVFTSTAQNTAAASEPVMGESIGTSPLVLVPLGVLLLLFIIIAMRRRAEHNKEQ